MRDAWEPFILGPQDDWSKVANGEDRKRIQNRLSQRARRAQLRAKRTTPKACSVTSVDAAATESSSSPDKANSSGNVLSPVDNFNDGSIFSPLDSGDTICPPAAITGAITDGGASPQSLSNEVLSAVSSPSVSSAKAPPLSIEPHFLFLASTSIVAACMSNATLLNISCTSNQPRTFHLSHSSAPTSLEPTLLQKTIPHPPVIDIIPFPGVRNRLIRCLNVIDLGKLSQDLVDDAFRVWGHTAWECTGWEVSETFARRWWFLMDEQLIAVSNFWRRQRLEGALLLHNGEVTVEK